jgi:hypothetical protein
LDVYSDNDFPLLLYACYPNSRLDSANQALLVYETEKKRQDGRGIRCYDRWGAQLFSSPITWFDNADCLTTKALAKDPAYIERVREVINKNKDVTYDEEQKKFSKTPASCTNAHLSAILGRHYSTRYIYIAAEKPSEISKTVAGHNIPVESDDGQGTIERYQNVMTAARGDITLASRIFVALDSKSADTVVNGLQWRISP